MSKRTPAPFDPEKFVDAFEASVKQDDVERRAYYAEQEALVAAREAVVKAAMAWWNDKTPWSSPHARMCLSTWSAFRGACAALAKIESDDG